MSQDVVSFVLRFVREMGEDQQARWRGIIRHVQGDNEAHFTQFSEALAFMQTQVNDVIRAAFDGADRPDEANPFLETARLWGDLMPRYTQMMMDSMQEAAREAMRGSGPMTQQMEQMMAASLALWGLPSRTDQERTADSLDALTEQLTAVTAKMEALESRLAALQKPPQKPASRRRATQPDDD